MPAPQPQPLHPDEAASFAREVMQRAKFPVLATMDGDQPRARPVSPVRTDGFTLYIANLRRYGKTRELAANPLAELCYTDELHNQVRITARAEEVTDAKLLAELWSGAPLLRAYLGSLENPQLIIYRFTPLRVRCMREWALDYTEVAMDA
jgi:general stress protein 26